MFCCGWKKNEIYYLGTKIFAIKLNDEKNIAFLATKVSNDYIKIELFVPDINGEKMKAVFDRKSQMLIQLENSDILDMDSFNNLLNIANYTVKNNEKYSTFIPTKKHILGI